MRAWTLSHDGHYDVAFGPKLTAEPVEVIEMAGVSHMVSQIKSALDSLSYAAPEMWPHFFGEIKAAVAAFEERAA